MTIRKANVKDADYIVALSKEMGYNPDKSELIEKVKRIRKDEGNIIYVACNTSLVGWIHVSLVDPIESSKFAEIRGFVVNRKYRNQGIGTRLILEAENWAKKKGCKKLRVRTNIIREETREYYLNKNFKSKKFQEVFDKII